MMKDYYQKSMRALQLSGMSERTQECYTRSIRMLVDFYKKSPDLATEAEKAPKTAIYPCQAQL
jgi:predicted phosphoadenosine phosphosulfate sulfurtransferase